MYQVDSEDAAFLFAEQADNPAHLGLLALYDQSECKDHVIRFQHILKHMKNRLNSAPVFQQKLKRIPADLDYPYWIEDEAFDLEYHVSHLALPKPGDWRQLCIQISRLHSRALDIRRPLWELYVIEGLDRVADLPQGSFALYFKIHHCAMDEFTAIELLESLHETAANPGQHEHSPTQIMRQPAVEPGTLDIFAQMLAGNLVRSMRFSLQSLKHRRLIGKRLMRSGTAALQQLKRAEDPEERHFATAPGPARVFGGGFYPREVLDSFTALVPGADIQHTLALVCGEATRCYMASKGEDDKSGHAGRYSAQLQVNVRNAGAHARSGNIMALQHVELYAEVENLIERLYAIVGACAVNSDTELELKRHTIRAVYENIPAPLLSILGRWSSGELRSLEAGGSCGISTLLGPAEPIYFLGARMADLTSVSPLYKDCGLMYSTSLYGDRVCISFTSGRDILPDPEALRHCLDKSIEKITALCTEPVEKTPKLNYA